MIALVVTKMIKTQIIYCPNCGDRATRSIIDDSIRRTSCPSCDYLLVQCAKTSRVIEAYAPGVNSFCKVDYDLADTLDALSCPQAASASKPRE